MPNFKITLPLLALLQNMTAAQVQTLASSQLALVAKDDATIKLPGPIIVWDSGACNIAPLGSTLNNTTLSKCNEACHKIPKCTYITYNIHSNSCFLSGSTCPYYQDSDFQTYLS